MTSKQFQTLHAGIEGQGVGYGIIVGGNVERHELDGMVGLGWLDAKTDSDGDTVYLVTWVGVEALNIEAARRHTASDPSITMRARTGQA